MSGNRYPLVSCSPLCFPNNVFVPPSCSSNLLKVVDFFGYMMYGIAQVSKISNQVHKIPVIGLPSRHVVFDCSA